MCALLAASLLAAGVPLAAQEGHDHFDHSSSAAEAAPRLALMGTIPIYWGEAAGLGEIIEGSAHGHWARPALERDFELVPLDFLTEEALAGENFLLMAQPRALAPQENVALDSWVRSGGRLLLFVDPMMTGHSRFSIGDKRRPMDVTLLSPILAHWGLQLQFDEAQDGDVRMLDHFAVPIPARLPGQFVPADGRFECVVSGEGILAHCALGSGEVLALADAAILDLSGPYQGAEEGLYMLTSHLFVQNGDERGSEAPNHAGTGAGHVISPDFGAQMHHPSGAGPP